MEYWKNKIVGWLLALMIMIVVIAGATVFTLNFKTLYYFDVDYLGIETISGMTKTEIKTNYDALIAYNQFNGPKELDFPSLPMSDSGRKHFVEVKQVFLTLEAAGIVCLFGILFAMLRKKITRSVVKKAGILMIVIPALVGILMAIGWEWAFTAFHQLVFGNEDWLFDPMTDPVITMLPDEFFMHCAFLIVGIVLLCAMLCLGYNKKKSIH